MPRDVPEREVGAEQAADRAQAKSVTRETGGDDDSGRPRQAIDHRQRVGGHIDEAAPGAGNRRPTRDRQHVRHAFDNPLHIGCRWSQRALGP